MAMDQCEQFNKREMLIAHLTWARNKQSSVPFLADMEFRKEKLSLSFQVAN